MHARLQLKCPHRSSFETFSLQFVTIARVRQGGSHESNREAPRAARRGDAGRGADPGLGQRSTSTVPFRRGHLTSESRRSGPKTSTCRRSSTRFAATASLTQATFRRCTTTFQRSTRSSSGSRAQPPDGTTTWSSSAARSPCSTGSRSTCPEINGVRCPARRAVELLAGQHRQRCSACPGWAERGSVVGVGRLTGDSNPGVADVLRSVSSRPPDITERHATAPPRLDDRLGQH
jgi:hypothetical protein